MTTKIPTDPKDSIVAAATPEHGCCGGEAMAEPRKDASKLVDHDHHAHAAPSKAASSSCCCGATKDSAADDTKSHNVVSK